jgi:Na+/phosphate symporter
MKNANGHAHQLDIANLISLMIPLLLPLLLVQLLLVLLPLPQLIPAGRAKTKHLADKILPAIGKE